jgi:hypothetical protein
LRSGIALLTKEQILFWLHKFRGVDITKREQRQRLIDTFVNAVYLYDDKAVLTFNYQDGTKTITFADVESAFGSDLESFGAWDQIWFMAAGNLPAVQFRKG